MLRKLLLFSYLAIFIGFGCARIEPLKPGDAVWAEWTPELWYHGHIESTCERGFKIRFDAQDEKCSPPEELAKDITPTRMAMNSGMPVLVPSPEGFYRRAKVLEEKGWKYQVEFLDGLRGEFPIKELRLPFVSTLKN